MTDLRTADRGPLEGRAIGQLREHLVEVHVDRRITLDEVLELLDNRVQGLGMGVHPLREECGSVIGPLLARSTLKVASAKARVALRRRTGIH